MLPGFSGRMFTFHNDPFCKIPVFLSGDHKRCMVWLGSQVDGFFSLNYMPQLTEELSKIGWSVAQLMTSSSLTGHGGRTHVGDAEDLDTLMGILINDFMVKEVTLFASSTGVQVALEFLGVGEHAELVTRCVFQGVVRDPTDYIFTAEGVKKRMAAAEDLAQRGRKEEMDEMRPYYDIPVSVGRVVSGGYLTAMEAFWAPAKTEEVETLAKSLSVVRVPCLIMMALGAGYYATKAEKESVQEKIVSFASTQEMYVSFFEDVSDERRRMLKTMESQHTAAIVCFLEDQDTRRRQREEQEMLALQDTNRKQRSVLAKSSLAKIM